MNPIQNNLSQGLKATGKNVAANLRYWEEQYAAETYSRFQVQQTGSPVHTVSRTLEPLLAERLQEMSGGREASLRLMLLCVYALLISRYTGRHRFLLGTLSPEQAPGTPLLPVSVSIDPAYTFKELLLSVKTQYETAQSHAAFPVRSLLEKLGLENEHQLYAAYFGVPALTLVPATNTPLPLILDVVLKDQNISLYLHSGEGLNMNAGDFLDHFVHLLEQVVHTPYALHASYVLPGKAAQQALLAWGTGTRKDFTGRHILDVWEQHVHSTPVSIALTGPEGNITYATLDDLSSRIAAHLHATFAVAAGDVVAVACERGRWQIASLMAILKLGAAFVSIDPALPESRILFMLEDAGTALLITDIETINTGSHRKWLTTGVPEDLPVAGFLPLLQRNASAPAYIIYTSGTTGQPKGTPVQHGSFVNMILDQQEIFSITCADKILQFASASFDAAVFEIFLALLSGARLVQVTQEIIRSPAAFETFVGREEISFTLLPPVYLSQLDKERMRVVKTITVGGDYPVLADLKELVSKGVRCYNLYGPSETAVIAAAYAVTENDEAPLPVGRPVSNTFFYVLDEYLQLLPAGIRGELYIGGAGVGQGYHGLPAITAQKFIAHPLSESLLYRTGDWAWWRNDGQLVLDGRVDEQVKINGYRIEPMEVQYRLAAVPGIKQAVVITDAGADGATVLRAFFTAATAVVVDTLFVELQQLLPLYMLPASLLQVAQIPLTHAGKTDRRTLLEYWARHQEKTQEVKVLTGDSVGADIQRVWKQVLQRSLGVDQHFFKEGGDSIKAIQVCARLNGMGYAVKVSDIYTYPTIRQLQKVVSKPATVEDMEAIEGIIPLSPVQRFFLAQQQPEPWHYNQAILLKMNSSQDPQLLNNAFNRLLAHHDALRITFSYNGNGYTQFNQTSPLSLTVCTHDFRQRENAAEAMLMKANEVQSLLVLERAPLLRVDHYQLNDHDYLGITIHHLVIDALSWGVLLQDLDHLLGQTNINDAILPAKTNSWKKWCEALDQYRSLPAGMPLPALKGLHADNDKHARLVSNTATISILLDEEVTRQLDQEVHRAYGTNVQDFLIASIAASLLQQWGIDAISMDIETHGRQLLPGMDVSRTIGWFTGIYPFHLERAAMASLPALLVHTKDTLRDLRAHALDYMQVMQTLEPVNRPGILFNYLGAAAGTDFVNFEWSDVMPTATQSPLNKRNYDWEINAIISSGKLLVSFTYDKNDYQQADMEVLTTAVKTNLLQLVKTFTDKDKHLLTPSDLIGPRLEWDELLQLQEASALEDLYLLTPMQEGMLYHFIIDPGTGFYTTQLGYQLSGTLDMDLLAAAYSQLIERHSGLRSNFIQDRAGHAWQIVKRDVLPVFKIADISHLDDAAATRYIDAAKQQELEKGFDLGSDLLMRIAVFKQSGGRYYFLWNYHHIIMDGWCMNILVSEWMTLYEHALRNTQANLPPAKPYRNYIAWLYEKGKETSYRYWEQYLENYQGNAHIPRTGIASKRTDVTARMNRELLIDVTTTDKIRQLAIDFNVTLNVLVQGVWSLILSRYAGTDDVVFGTVVSGRPAELEAVETMVGLFINTVPVRARLHEDQSFAGLLQQLQEHHIAGVPHQYCSLAEIQSRIGHAGSLVDHIMLFENFPVAENLEQSIAGQSVAHDFKITGATAVDVNNYPFTLVVVPGKQLQFRINFNPTIHPGEVIVQILDWFEVIFERLLESGDQPVHVLSRYPGFMQDLLLANGITPAPVLSEAATFTAQFQRSVVLYPHRPAIKDNTGTLTYAQLDAKANQLAYLLQTQYNVKPGSVVAVHMERSMHAFTAICGILKAGAVYVPVDPGWPDARKAFLLEDAAAVAVVTLFEFFADLSAFGCQVIAMDVQLDNEQLPVTTPQVNILPSDRAYIIYTSGSTGQPKGVQIRHQSNVNMAVDQVRRFGITQEDKVLQFAPLFFDASVYEWSIAWYAGACLFIPDERTIRDPSLFNTYLQQHDISMATLPPPFFNLLPANDTHWPRIVVQAGSAPDLHQTLAVSRYATCYNAYGPTECAVCAAVHTVGAEDEMLSVLPVGRAVGGTGICLLNERLEMVPMGAEGEICVWGPNISIGYTGPEASRQQVFTRHPFIPGEIIYRTGDMGRMLPGAELVYTGRKDRQLKIKGSRIEPREIETVARQLKGVAQIAVGAGRDGNGMQILVAYVVAKNGFSEKQLKQQLQAALPAYMVPDRLIAVPEIIQTANGKVDFDALHKTSAGSAAVEKYSAPENEIEQQLFALWENTLGHHAFGVQDRFFEVGGNSLSLIRLHVQLKERYPGILIADLFNYNTIAGMALHISEAGSAGSLVVQAGIQCQHVMQPGGPREMQSEAVDLSAADWDQVFRVFADVIPGLEVSDLLLSFFCFVLYEGTGAALLKPALLDKNDFRYLQLLDVDIDAIDSREALITAIATQRQRHKAGTALQHVRFEKQEGEIIAAFVFGNVQSVPAASLEGIDLLLKTQLARNGDLRLVLEWQQQTITTSFAGTILHGMQNIIGNLIKNIP